MSEVLRQWVEHADFERESLEVSALLQSIAATPAPAKALAHLPEGQGIVVVREESYVLNVPAFLAWTASLAAAALKIAAGDTSSAAAMGLIAVALGAKGTPVKIPWDAGTVVGSLAKVGAAHRGGLALERAQLLERLKKHPHPQQASDVTPEARLDAAIEVLLKAGCIEIDLVTNAIVLKETLHLVRRKDLLPQKPTVG